MMKKTVFFGLTLVVLFFGVPFTLASGQVLIIDIFPDFLGFVLIFLGLDKLKYNNRFLKEMSSFAIIFAVISFITFACQMSPFYLSSIGLTDGSFAILGRITVFIKEIYLKFEYLFMAIYVLYAAVFAIALYTELRLRKTSAPILKKFYIKDSYSEIVYSKKAYGIYSIFSIVFSSLYVLVTIICVYNFFSPLRFDILGLTSEIWVLFLPIHIIFLFYLNTAINMVSEKRREDAS